MVHAWLVGSGCFCLFVWCSLCVVVVYSAFVGCVYVILRCFLWLVVYCPIVNVFCVFVFFGCGITWFLYEEEPPGGDPGGAHGVSDLGRSRDDGHVYRLYVACRGEAPWIRPGRDGEPVHYDDRGRAVAARLL